MGTSTDGAGAFTEGPIGVFIHTNSIRDPTEMLAKSAEVAPRNERIRGSHHLRLEKWAMPRLI